MVLAAALSACSDPDGSRPAEGEWSYQVGAVSGAAAIFVSDGRERLRVGCRANPPLLFVDVGASEDADKRATIAFGPTTINFDASVSGVDGAARLTPAQVDGLDDGAVAIGDMTFPPIAPDALAALQRGCSQVLASSAPLGALWTFSQAEGRAVLAFALPDSDYPGPRFECERGAGEARLTLQAVRAQPRRIVATAGDGRLEGPVSFEPDQLNGGEIWSTSLPANHAVLRGLEQTGHLRIEQPAPQTSYASEGAGPAAARFRAACAIGGKRG